MKKYFRVVKNSWDEYLVYRLNFILWRVRVVIRFLITFFLWSAIFTPGKTYFGYDQSLILTYTLLTYLAGNFILATRTQEIGAEINDGRLTNILLRPVNYFLYLGSRDVSDKLFNFGFTVVETLLILFILKPPLIIPTQIATYLFFIIAVLVAISLYFLTSSFLGLFGFWTTEVWALRFTFFILVDFLSGNLIPIDIFPSWLFQILQLTPFPYIIFFPVKIFLGQITGNALLGGFAISFFWIAILGIGVHMVWRRGLQNYTAVGR